jgi:monoamine oxidase
MSTAPSADRVDLSSSPSASDDVLVLGAGLAGLFAARQLARRGLRVRVLEARDRVGGRTLSHRLPSGDVVELGAQWLGPGQDLLIALVRELGLATLAQPYQGKKVLALGDRLTTYDGDIPSLSILALLDLHRTLSRVDAMAKQVPPAHPADAPEALSWDGMTVESWKQAHVHTAHARALFDIAVAAIFAAEPSELSLLYFLHYIHAGNGIMNLSTIRDGAQQTRLVEGFQQVSLRMADDPSLAGRIHLCHPVRAVVDCEDGVRVTADSESGPRTFQARYVIVAIPPALCGRIDFQPALPTAREQLQQRMPMGSVCKCIATYSRPFWRERDFSGEAVCDRGPIRAVFDDSSADGQRGGLLGFMLGDHLRSEATRDPEVRKQAVLAAFARFFGEEALHPESYVEKNWSTETYSGGCYSAVMPPATLTRFGHALRAPIGRIHFAGTETATRFPGYMEGALESGARAASEVAARLRSGATEKAAASAT